MGWVQNNHTPFSVTGGTLTMVFNGVTAGDSLVILLSTLIEPSASSVSATIGDSQSNSYTPIFTAPYTPGNLITTRGWIAQAVGAGTITITINVTPSSAATNYVLSAVGMEYSGLMASAVDVGNSTHYAPTTGNAALNTGAVLTTSPDEVLLTFFYTDVFAGGGWSTSPGAGWTQRNSSFTTGFGFQALLIVSDQTVSTLVTRSANWQLSNSTSTGEIDVGIFGLKLIPVPPPPIISLETQPGFFDISDSVLACLNPLADYDLIKIKYNADLALVRPELFFMGYYTDGDSIPLPVSPADGYEYLINEMLCFFQLGTTQPPLGGFTPGQQTLPGLAFTSSPVDGFLCAPYQLRPNFGNLTSQGESTISQFAVTLEFYEHGDTTQNIAQQAYSAGATAVYGFGQRKSAPLSPVLPGSTLITASQPSFYDFPDSAIHAGAPITDQMMQAISRNAKLGVFRFEIIFMGYYRNGDTVPLPVGAGEYEYSRAECIFMPLLASTRQPSGDFTPGQILFPSLADLDIYAFPGTAFPQQLSINPATGAITCTIEGASGIEGQGTVAVFCFAQRYPNLTMASQPVWAEISDESLVGGQVPTAALLQQLNDNAKFGIVAREAQFLGYFENGDTPPALVSPADGYTYAFHETIYIPVWVSSKPASGLTPGQKTFPSLGSNLGSGTITSSPYQCFINQYKDPLGKLTVTMWQGGVQIQGIVAVYAIGTRRQNPTGTLLG